MPFVPLNGVRSDNVVLVSETQVSLILERARSVVARGTGGLNFNKNRSLVAAYPHYLGIRFAGLNAILWC